MVYKYDFYEGNKKELAYDLRQGMAEIWTETLKNIKKYRDEREYLKWFEELDGLFIDISMKLEPEEKDDYSDLMSKANELIEESPNLLKKPNQFPKLYSQLRKINMWILDMMEKYNMFGSKEYDNDEGL